MAHTSHARLKSTGEPVIILPSGGADQRAGTATSGYRLCLLPPQAPRHRKRFEWIRRQKVREL